MKPRKGDLFLVTNNPDNLWDKITFKLTIWGTKSPYVHCGIYVGREFGHDEPQVIEACPGGVCFTPYTKYKDAVWSKLDLSKSQREAIVNFAGSCIGMKYARLGLIATTLAQSRMGNIISPYKTLDKQPFWVRKLIHENAIYCSSLCVLSYLNAGISIVQGYGPWFTSTGDLTRSLGVISESHNIKAGRIPRRRNSWNWISGRINFRRIRAGHSVTSG